MLESHAAGAAAVARKTSERPLASGSTPRPRLHLRDQAADFRHRLAQRLREIRRRYLTERERLIGATLCVDAAAAGELVGVSARQWRHLDATDQCPAPIRLGGAVRWRLTELAGWVDAGCPDRITWEAMK